MKVINVKIFSFMFLILTSLPSQAVIVLSLNPSTQNVAVGSSVGVALVISGLNENTSPSLSTFDLDINFNPSFISLANVTFGDPILDDQLDIFGQGTISIATSAVDSLNLFELSLDSSSDLNNFQAGSFTLATLFFNGLSQGNTILDVSINSLGDSFGNPLEAEIQNGVINVPEPPAVLLVGLGILTIFCSEKRKSFV